MWNNDDDTAVLRDASGNVVHRGWDEGHYG